MSDRPDRYASAIVVKLDTPHQWHVAALVAVVQSGDDPPVATYVMAPGRPYRTEQAARTDALLVLKRRGGA